MGVFSVFTAALCWARRRARESADTEIADSPVFAMPLAAALALSSFGSPWIYPQAPRVLWAMLGVLALGSSVLILRRLLRSEIHPLLYALIGFFFFDQLRSLTAAVEFLPRVVLLAEMFAVIVVSIWLIRRTSNLSPASPEGAWPRKLLKIADTSF